MEKRESRAVGDQSDRSGRGNGAGNYPYATAATQRRRLHAYLRDHGNISTTEARAALAIMAPAARVWELRHDEGHRIITERDSHRVARYYLLPPAAGGERV